MEFQSKKYLDDILYAVTLIEEFLAGVNSFADLKAEVQRKLDL